MTTFGEKAMIILIAALFILMLASGIHEQNKSDELDRTHSEQEVCLKNYTNSAMRMIPGKCLKYFVEKNLLQTH